MKLYVKSARYMQYDGKMIRVEDGESHSQAAARYRDNLEKERLAAEEAKQLAKEEKIRKAEYRKTHPKYKEHDIVQTKNGYYYELYNPSYNSYDETITYDGIKCDRVGKWMKDDWEEEDFMDPFEEIYQTDIQRKVGHKN